MLRESNLCSRQTAGRERDETLKCARLNSTPVNFSNNLKCPPPIVLLAHQLRDMSPLSSPIHKTEQFGLDFTRPRDVSSLSQSSSRCSKMTNAYNSMQQQSTFSELYTAGSVSSHLNLPSAQSLEVTTWSRSLECSSLPTSCEEPTYIYDCSTRTTYHKGKYLGKGGFARVHEFEDVATGNVYAGKIIPKSRITKPRHMEKINREIVLHKSLVHDNIVRFYHCFEDENNVYIILENCARRSLAHLMKQRKTLTEKEARNFLRQLADGLRYLHQRNIVHRDLKLGNMLLTEDLKLKICDFGLASYFEPDSKVSVCGTPNYIAPEVLHRQAHGFEADIWAVGCIMYAILVGQPPFETLSLEDTYARIAENAYELPRWISRSARSLIRQLLAADPCERPTLEEMLSHDFFTGGAAHSMMSSDGNANESNGNDSGFRSDLDSTNENASSAANQVLSYTRLKPTSSLGLSDLGTHDDAVFTSTKQVEPFTKACQTLRSSSTNGYETKTNQLKDKYCVKGGATTKPPTVDINDRLENNTNRLQSLYTVLNTCIESAPQVTANPQPVPFQPIYVSKWIDYSNRHGFGFQLCNGYVGILFNDCSRIGYSERRSCVDFQDETGKQSNYRTDALPAHLPDKLTLLSYFVRYMDENMIDGGGSQAAQTSFSSAQYSAHQEKNQLSSVHMKRWVRTPEAIIMQLNDNTLQINFFADHTKVVLSSSVGRNGAIQFWVTYVNSERSSSTYNMADIAKEGCDGILRERLVYALTVLREFEELDSENKL